MTPLTLSRLEQMVNIGFKRPSSLRSEGTEHNVIINNQEDVIKCSDVLKFIDNFRLEHELRPEDDPYITYKGRILDACCYLLPNDDICLKTSSSTLELSQGNDSIPKERLLNWIESCKAKIEEDPNLKSMKSQDEYKQLVKGARIVFKVLEGQVSNYTNSVEIGGDSNE